MFYFTILKVIFEKYLLEKFSTKSLYLFTYALYVVSCVIIYFLDNIYAILPFCFSFGILLTALSTLPYQMLSEFHKDDSYVNRSKDAIKRGL